MTTANSSKLFEELASLTPGGAQTKSKEPSRYVNGVYPKVLEGGYGAEVWDADGNRYIDFICGLGAISLGYANDLVNNYAILQMKKGVSFSLPNHIEAQVAKRLCELVPSTDMWKFTKTGSDADSMAVKVARGYTQREKVLVCGYHGWHDWYSVVNDKRLGIPLILSDLISKARYNNLQDFEVIKNREYAAVIMEPMVFDYPEKGFLEGVRELCDKTGTLLILDEVVTGGRYPGFVAQNYFGVRPDITVLSKGIANGFPLAAVGARRPIMEVFDRDDFFASTTFGGECVSLAACLATLLQIEQGVDKAIEKGDRLKSLFNKLFEGTGAGARGFPTRTSFDFPTSAHKALFWQECLKQGVLFGYSNFILQDITDDQLAFVGACMMNASLTVKQHWDKPLLKLEGALPVEPLRMRTNG